MKIRMILGCVTAWLLGTALAAQAGERVYLHPDDFVSQTFSGDAPAAQALWIQPSLREELASRFGFRAGLRVRYWAEGGRTAWILDEIGKDRPITAGIVVESGRITNVEVLVFRESRGWEIRNPGFTRQFVSAALDPDARLTQPIDGITGATLSVTAMKRMARVALKLHDQTPARTLARAD